MRFLFLFLPILGGCASMDQLQAKLENRVVCTVAKDKALVVSEWGPIGIASTISEKDRAVICAK